MTIDEVLKLVEAGYTADDIKAFDNPEPDVVDVETPPENKTFTGGQLEALEASKPIDVSVYTKALETKLDELVATVSKLQADNIDGAQGGTPTPAPSIEEMVANFTKDM